MEARRMPTCRIQERKEGPVIDPKELSNSLFKKMSRGVWKGLTQILFGIQWKLNLDNGERRVNKKTSFLP